MSDVPVEIAALASQYSVPVSIPISDNNRHGNCNANEAVLSTVEGKYAVYQGVCANRHKYEQRILIKQEQQAQEAVEDFKLKDGKLTIGDGEGFKAEELEEF